jgi:hypothetical protein
MIDKKLKAIFEAATGKKFDEAVGDNKVDNLVSELTRCTEQELLMFSCSQMNGGAVAFQQQYSTPQFDGFKSVLASVVDRWRVMDDNEKLDLTQKIELLFKDLMIKNWGALGPETAELIASRYTKQMIDFLKKNNLDPQKPIDQLYPHRRDIAPKTDVVNATTPKDQTTPPLVQANAKAAPISGMQTLKANPY